MRAFALALALALALAAPLAARAADGNLEALELKARALAEKVEATNEGVFRVKARLLAMRLGTDRPQGRLRLHHSASLGPALRLTGLSAAVDGLPVTDPLPTSGLDRPLLVMDEWFDAGRHTYDLRYELQGAALPGLPYLQTFRLELRAQCPFELRPDTVLDVSATLSDDDLTKAFKDRPSVSCDLHQAEIPAPPGS